MTEASYNEKKNIYVILDSKNPEDQKMEEFMLSILPRYEGSQNCILEIKKRQIAIRDGLDGLCVRSIRFEYALEIPKLFNVDSRVNYLITKWFHPSVAGI